MTDQTRNVELVIRANNQSKKTLEAVRKEIEEINKVIDDQVEASKRGQGSVKDLDAAYRQLEAAMKSLISQQSLITKFEDQQKQLEKLQAALVAASTRLKEHEAAMAAAEKVTKRQEQTQVRLAKAYERAEKAVQKQSERVAKTREEGEALGISMNNLVDSQDKLLAVGRNLATTNDVLADATANYAENVRRARAEEKKLAEEDAFQKKARDAQELNKASEYVRLWEDLLHKADAAEAELRDSTAFQKKAAEAQRLVQAGEYVDFWIKELEKLDAAERQIADNSALNKAADEAIAAARGYTTLGDATKRLVQNAKPLAGTLQQIVNPTAAARSTLDGLEEQINSLAKAINSVRGPVKDYRAQVAQLTAAQKALAAQATGIDAYQKQVENLRAARTAFVQSRAAVLEYAATMRTAGTPTAEMQTRLRALQSALAASSAQLQQQVVRTRELRTGLQQAGVATNDLAGAQNRLVSSARTSTEALSNLEKAVKRYGEETDRSNNSNGFFQENGRTTLSLMQRWRGELLALAAAYVGLQAGVDLAASSIEKLSSKQGIQNQLALSVGNDPKAIGDEYKYIQQQADRIGLSFEDAAKGFTKFSAAAKIAGRSSQEVHFIFETFSEVGRVANLSVDDMNGVFKALEQVISKGKIQAEELRGQLGDRLFGAFEIAAKALKDQFPNLDKAMKDGEVTANQLVRIAEQYKKTVADQLPAAMQSLAANQARLNTEIFNFKVLIAETGFGDAYQKLLARLIEFFRSEDGTKFAESIGTAFATLANVLTFVLDHLNEIQLVLSLAFGLKAATMVAGMATAFGQLAKQAALAAIAIQTGTKNVGLMTKAFGTLQAFIVGWSIGEYLSSEFEFVRQAGISLVVGLLKAWTEIKYNAQIAASSILEFFQNNFKKIYDACFEMAGGILVLLKNTAEAVGATDIASSLDSQLKTMAAKQLKGFKGDANALKGQMEQELKEIDEIGYQMFQDASDAARKAADEFRKKQEGLATATPMPKLDDTPAADPKPDKEYEKLVKRRIALADELVRALEQAEAKIQRNEKLSLADRLAAIETEYAKVFRRIDELAKLPGGEEQAKQMRVTLQGYVEQLKKQETLKFNQEEMARREKAINDLLQLRQQLLTTIDAQQKAGTLPKNKVKDAIAGVDERVNPQIQEAVASAREFALANQQAFGDQTALDTYLAKLDAISAGLLTVSTDLYSVDQANQDIASGLTGAFDSFAESIAAGEDAVSSFRDAFLKFVADFLKKIALMIIQQIILNSLQNSSIGGAISGFVSGAAKAHSGAVIGSGNRGGTNVNVPSSWFAGAPRYHTGGIVGLASDEYPTILQRNEEVLAADDPRNVLNGGTATDSGTSATPQDVTVVNTFDAMSFLNQALSTDKGRKLIMNVVTANKGELKQLVGRG